MVLDPRSGVEVMEGNQPRVEVNILLLGAPNVGKTALAVRFLTRRFIGEYGAIESVYSRVDRVDGQEICFNIWDSQSSQSTGDLRRHRDVSGEEGRLLALSQRCGFFEVSAAETYHGVLPVFHRLVHLVREARALRKSAAAPAPAAASVRGIVRSVSAVFAKKRAE